MKFNPHDTFKMNILNFCYKKSVLILYILLILPITSYAIESKVDLLNAPENFNIQIFAENIPSPRQITEGNGYLFSASHCE